MLTVVITYILWRKQESFCLLTHHTGQVASFCGGCSATVAAGSAQSRYQLRVQVSSAGTLKRLKRRWFISLQV